MQRDILHRNDGFVERCCNDCLPISSYTSLNVSGPCRKLAVKSLWRIPMESPLVFQPCVSLFEKREDWFQRVNALHHSLVFGRLQFPTEAGISHYQILLESFSKPSLSCCCRNRTAKEPVGLNNFTPVHPPSLHTVPPRPTGPAAQHSSTQSKYQRYLVVLYT